MLGMFRARSEVVLDRSSRHRRPQILYLVSAILFITALKRLGSPGTARQGNLVSLAGMLLASGRSRSSTRRSCRSG